MNDPKEHAMQLQLDAAIAEVLGRGPADDLAAQIVERLRTARAARGQPLRRLLTAAALVLGVVAVGAALLWQDRDGTRSAQAPPPPAPRDPAQDPQAPLDAATLARIDQLARQLELVDSRKDTFAALCAIGPAATPRLRELLAAELTRSHTATADLLTSAIMRLPLGAGAAGLRPEPVTLIADYSDNRVLMVGADGRVLLEIDDSFGAWDAKLTPQGTILITEFSVSRVREVDLAGNDLWDYDTLKNPYRASRLANGNTLIADTFGSRVIEVTPAKQIVWQYDKDIRPFDCERLANGDTLIADVLGGRVLEVSPAGEIVWQVPGMSNVHDADRLANGNTLITLRSKGAVVEVDRAGKVVWELTGLSSPSDADRLPNGHTLVAENTRVREFDADKEAVWAKEMTWAVAAQRY